MGEEGSDEPPAPIKRSPIALDGYVEFEEEKVG